MDPDYEGPFFYYDENGEYLENISVLPHRPFEENKEPLNVTYDPATHILHGNRDAPRQPLGPPNQGQPLYVQTPQGQPLYGPPYPGQSGDPHGQPYQGQPVSYLYQ